MRAARFALRDIVSMYCAGLTKKSSYVSTARSNAPTLPFIDPIRAPCASSCSPGKRVEEIARR